MNLLITKKAAQYFGTEQRIICTSIQDASNKWCELRDKSCLGYSDIGNGGNVLDDNGKRIAKISYNGRIWN